MLINDQIYVYNVKGPAEKDLLYHKLVLKNFFYMQS